MYKTQVCVPVCVRVTQIHVILYKLPVKLTDMRSTFNTCMFHKTHYHEAPVVSSLWSE